MPFTEQHRAEEGEVEEPFAFSVRDELDFAIEDIDWELDDESLERIASIEAQIEEILSSAEHRLENLDAFQEEASEDAIDVHFENGKLLYFDEEGNPSEITKGELVTDGEWGVSYSLDSSVPSKLRQEYVLENAKREIRVLSNKKLLLQQIANPHLDSMKRETYRRILDDQEQGIEHFGFVAERMVKNFFKKMAIDNDFGFEVHEASVIQDVEQKVDFILHRKSHYRGVGVEAADNVESDIGVQFTINNTPQKIWSKKGQLQKTKSAQSAEHIEDIVLVTMDKRQFSSFYNKWLKHKLPGGPDRLWHLGIKEEVFRKTLRKFMPSEEIDVHWKAATNK